MNEKNFLADGMIIAEVEYVFSISISLSMGFAQDLVVFVKKNTTNFVSAIILTVKTNLRKEEYQYEKNISNFGVGMALTSDDLAFNNTPIIFNFLKEIDNDKR